jgi:hypothetical protein
MLHCSYEASGQDDCAPGCQCVTVLITAVITDTVAATADRLTDRFAGLQVNLRTASATGALANM